MKYISEKDSIWHDVDKEMPSTTTDVEFLKHDGTIIKGHIVIDMSGAYASLPAEGGVGYIWSSFDYYKAWRRL